MDDFLRDLNVAQKQAVTHGEGPLLIVAGAGTGKTTVITRRIAWLIAQGQAKPEEILALTFTDKAAAEMEERVDRLLPYGYVNVWVSTFHAFGERMLKDYALEIGLPNDFKVFTAAEQWMLMRRNLEKFDLDYYRPLGNPAKFIHALLQHFSRAKDELISPADYLKYAQDLQLNNDADQEESSRLREVAQAYHVYQQLLLEQGVLDFGDLINYTLHLLQKRPRILTELRNKFKYIMVDEFQDTNIAQYELVKRLAAPGNNLTVVGDDDQSVYKFRGASLSNILEFTKDYPQCGEILLTENYRSYQNILDTAYGFIQQNNPYRLEKTLTRQGKTLSKKLSAVRSGAAIIEYKVFRTAEDEAEGVVKQILTLRKIKSATDFSDFAILVRANSSALVFLHALRNHGIPFNFIANRGLFSEDIIMAVVSYLKLLDNYHESAAVYRVLSGEPFMLPHDDLVALSQFAGRKAVSLFETLRAAPPVPLSESGTKITAQFLRLVSKHSLFARTATAAALYVQVIDDLGIAERVAHPALARDAQYLAEFYTHIQRFELSNPGGRLRGFLDYFQLELDSGEEGQLPEDTEEGPDTVKVITVHAAKGLEWKYVFLVQLVDRRFPSTQRREPIELPTALIKETLPEGDVHLQEERRLFYVALTRARDGIYLTRAEDYLGKTTRQASRFLVELGMSATTKEKAPKITARTVVTPASIRPARYPIPESFSFSSISAFRKCPLEYKFRYLLKLPTPGNGQMSFGITIHRTLELFLKIWQERARSTQGALFEARDGHARIPSFEELRALYERNWLDDWYESAEQKAKYKDTQGLLQLKNFYKHCASNPPRPKYLEVWFKVALGPHKFVGKIDRIDEGADGGLIIDYKTGQTAHKDLEKVDRDQLIIYQIAAEEFLREKIVGGTYWYLASNAFTGVFLAAKKEKDKLKKEYQEQIDTILEVVQNDAFVSAHGKATRHDCRYEQLR